MKHTKGLIALALVATLAVPAVTFAAKGDRKEKGNAFSKIDTDGNGSISESEFVAANSKRGTAEAAKSKFASLDKNHDGKLDKTELAGAKNDGEKKGRKKKDQE
jgi:Ca2+-binding EF-hand superfamily protein